MAFPWAYFLYFVNDSIARPYVCPQLSIFLNPFSFEFFSIIWALILMLFTINSINAFEFIFFIFSAFLSIKEKVFESKTSACLIISAKPFLISLSGRVEKKSISKKIFFG